MELEYPKSHRLRDNTSIKVTEIGISVDKHMPVFCRKYRNAQILHSDVLGFPIGCFV